MSNNPFIIIFIFVIIGIVIYCYYNYKNPNANDFVSDVDSGKYQIQKQKNMSKPKHKLKPKPKTKQVRFNDNIKYNFYNRSASNRSASLSPAQIYVDDIMSEDGGLSSYEKYNSPKCKRSPKTFVEIDLDDDVVALDTNVMPSNLDQTNPEETWDASFGLPLMSNNEKKDYFDKMQKNHKRYEKSLSEFTKYQTDSSTIIKTETTIDPFKPDHRSESLKGRAIKDIYDEQVAGPKAKPKRVKRRSSSRVIYEDESELNGGAIPGTNNLHGYDGVNETQKTAAFGNEF
jgi:hypothetical protein